MDTSSPFSSVSANPSFKGDLENLSQNTVQERGVLKTTIGDVTLSQSIEEGCNESLISLLGIASIYAAQEGLLPPAFQHNLIFLPPETVDLEIQIAELVQDLEKTPSSDTPLSLQKSTVSPNRPNPTTKSSIFSLQTKASSQSLPSLSSKEPSTQPLARPLAMQGQPSLFSHSEQNIVRAVPSSIVPHNRANPTSSQNSSNDNTRSHQSGLSTGITFFSQKEQDLSGQTNKTGSTEKEKQEGRQRENSDRERNGDDSYQEDDQSENIKISSERKNKNKTSSNQENENLEEAFSVSYFAYNSTSNQKSSQSTFRKRPPSPMSLFSSQNSVESLPKKSPRIENVFTRFMELMARILGQAEAEANKLYARVKERTDNVDSLTLLLSKINNEKGAIDWDQNAEMRALVDHAKNLGVSIGDSYNWSEDEKKLLKENIQMFKENMEKITQLERTDMQRLLQEVSQCHQTRSNVLKLLKELMDTFVHNLRP
jgi:hypothetical protein